MTVAPTLERYLASKNIKYDVIMHEPTMSSSRAAEACRIWAIVSPKRLCFATGAGLFSQSCRHHTTSTCPTLRGGLASMLLWQPS